MRDIKFRVWLKDEQKMVKGGCFMDVSQTPGVDRWVFGMDTFAHPDDLELMQYTGLKDKNGVEIYEGDLVRHSLRATPLPVGFSEGSFVYIDDKAGLSINCDVWDEREVIGNIYENPELLNSKEASTKGGESND